MNKPIANVKLWCRRGDRLIECDISVGKPFRDGEWWYCDWSMGDLMPHKLLPAKSMNSYLSLVSSMNSIAVFLKGRQDLGDKFYIDESEEGLLENVMDLFWPTYFPTPEESVPKN